MKIIVILSVCVVVTLSDVKSTKYLEAKSKQWFAKEAQTTIRVKRLPKPEAADKTSKVQVDEEYDKVVTTTMNNTVVEDNASKLRRSYLECVDETFVKFDLIVKFRAGSWAEHPSVLKWALCVLVKMGLMTPQGVYQYDTAMSKINSSDRNKVDKILDRCLTPKPLPPQKIAWKYLKCLREQDRKGRFPSLSIFNTLK